MKYFIKLIFFLFILLGINTAKANTPLDTLFTSIYFETASANLDKDAQIELTTLAEKIKNLADYNIQISAYTDERGSMNYNEQLAKNRAKTVQQYLSSFHIFSDKIQLKSYGEREQIYDNNNSTTRRLNRRVDIKVIPIFWSSLENLTTQLQSKTLNEYTISANQPTKITGKAGTTLWITPNTFEYTDGTKVDAAQIQVKLTECLTYGDMLANNLFTSSGGKLLETGGMIKIEATANNRSLQLKKGQYIQTAIPTQEFDNRMQLFYGETTSNGDLADWMPINQKPTAKLSDQLVFAPKPIKPRRRSIEWEQSTSNLNPPKEPTFNKKAPRYVSKDAIKYNPPFLQRIFMSKEKIEAQKEKLYQWQLSLYYKRTETYQTALAKHQKDLDNYKKALAQYNVLLNNKKKNAEKARKAFYNSTTYKETKAHYDSLYTLSLAKYEIDLENWQKYKAKKLARFEQDYEQNGITSTNAINSYLFKVTELGWVNIDVFYNSPAEKGELQLANLNGKDVSAFVLFKSINSVIRLQPNANGQYATEEIPVGSDVEVVALKVKNGKALMAKEQLTISKEQHIELNFQPAKLQDIREVMAALD